MLFGCALFHDLLKPAAILCKVLGCVKAQNTDLLTYALIILAPKGWEKTEDAPFGYEAFDSLSTRFKVPLEKAEVDCSVLQEEWDDMVDYARRYLNLVTLLIINIYLINKLS